MRNEVLIIDLANTIFSKTIRSRQNDKGGLKLTVYLKENGRPINLTGYTVKYEAINNVGKFTRDDAIIVDITKGIIEYVFSKEAVSTPGEWNAYFVCEKNETERFSTQDIKITLGRDVKEGNIKIENYISEFEIIKKTLDELQKKLSTMDVVKKSGDTMPGNLLFDRAGTVSTNKIAFSTAGVEELNFYQTGDGYYGIRDVKGNQGVWDYNRNNKTFNVSTNTNLVKKTGDIINGLLEFKIDNAIVLGSRSFKSVIHKGSQGELIFAPSTKEQGDSWDWSKRVEFRTDGTIRQAYDTGWINLPTTGVETIADRIMKYKRSGEQISVIGSVKNPANTTAFATLPVGFRPVQNIAFPALAYGAVPTVCEVTVKSDGGIFVNGVQSGNTIHIAMNFLI